MEDEAASWPKGEAAHKETPARCCCGMCHSPRSRLQDLVKRVKEAQLQYDRLREKADEHQRGEAEIDERIRAASEAQAKASERLRELQDKEASLSPEVFRDPLFRP